MPGQWLSIVEYARSYNISDMTVRRRIKTGRLEAVLKDGKYFIPVDGKKEEHDQRSLPGRDSHSRSIYNRPPLHANNSHLEMSDTLSNVGLNEIQNNTPPISQKLPIDPKELLSLCEHKVKSSEAICAEQKKCFEAIISRKDEQISRLSENLQAQKQKVEDLQLLIQIFERKVR